MVTRFITSFDERVTESQPSYRGYDRAWFARDVSTQFWGFRTHPIKDGIDYRVDSGECSAGTSPKQKGSGSIRNDVLLYKKLIRPMMDYACPVWRFAARSHIMKLQLLQSKCLRIANTGNKQIHDDLAAPFFTDHIRSLRDSTQS
jgi:hypothetical protein